jgi:hypothetical protein
MPLAAEVLELQKLGPLPSEDQANVALLRRYEELLRLIQAPVSDEDARALVALFGPDECYGLAWSLLHLVESAPHWPLADALKDIDANEWIQRLKTRADNRHKTQEP